MICSDGYKVNNYPNIEEFFIQDGIYLSENRPSTVSQGQVNIYAKTFIFNNKKYVLFATINTSDYKEILSRIFFFYIGKEIYIVFGFIERIY